MHQISVILVEDDMGHASLIKKNLKRSGMQHPIVSFGDGHEALDFLASVEVPKNLNVPPPYFVLLDLNMPGLDGYQLLRRIKENPKTAHLVVGILTTTSNRREVERCYELGCNFYLTKPAEYEHFATAIKNLGEMLSMLQVPEGDLANENVKTM